MVIPYDVASVTGEIFVRLLEYVPNKNKTAHAQCRLRTRNKRHKNLIKRYPIHVH